MSRIILFAILMVAAVFAEPRGNKGLEVGFCASTIRGATYDLTDASHNGCAAGRSIRIVFL